MPSSSPGSTGRASPQLIAPRLLGATHRRREAFLLAFDQAADYDSPNFLWFRDRTPRFVYVDRIVVAPAARGRGHARRLYDDLFAQARRAGHDQVVCEVNSEPANPASDAFHAALGFSEVGRATIHGGPRPCAISGARFQEIADLGQQLLFLRGRRGRRRGVLLPCLNSVFMPLITRNITQAMMMKFTATVMNWP